MLISMDPPESYGIALNVNCYSTMTNWGQFEALKAEIIEHLTAVAGEFGLLTFNNPDRNTFSLRQPVPAPDSTAPKAVATSPQQ